jgi:glycosyltransferase involved in cell wall biosynthesis
MTGTASKGVLVHEWISQAGGSENVLQALSEIYPDASMVCLWNESKGRFDPRRVQQTWLSRSPLRRSKPLALPFMPATWRRLPYRGYDWALISSHLFAHHARFIGQPADFPRFVYVHTPARYVWTPELDARGAGWLARSAATALKPIDRRRAQEGGSFAANSDFVRRRVAQAWGVDARVIYPPVEVDRIQSVPDWRDQLDEQETGILEGLPDGFILGASRFIPYKRLDLVIKAGELTKRPVVLAGRGPELPALQALARQASVPVGFVHAPSAPLLYALYQRTSLYVFPAIEDFGIMPVEAMAAGAPVLAHQLGGTAESVVPGRTGALVDFASSREISAGVEQALGSERAAGQARAREFSARQFAQNISSWVPAA